MLKLRKIAIDTYRENVAFLRRCCSVYRPEEFQALNKIEIGRDGRRILATLNIVDDERILTPGEIGLSEQAFKVLGLPEGVMVQVAPARPPASLDSIRAKVWGRELAPHEFDQIIQDIAANRYSRMEIAAFLISCASFLTTDEVLSLTRAMAKVGNRLSWKREPVVDKHSIGGIPGNRTSMIVVPIVAAHGLLIPKTSSRAITSPAGTADTMEVLARVDLSIEEMQAVVERENGCLVWGGHVELSPADDILISVERPLAIDTHEQLVASILSKKLAAGSSHLVVDIPIGPSAKVRSRRDAVRLRKLFEFIGDEVGLHLDVVFTDGAQPIGTGIGPVLEARDVMKVLKRDQNAPKDLREKSLLLAARILEFDPAVRGGKGEALAREILDSGRAMAAMERIVAAQGPAATTHALGTLIAEIPAKANGVVAAIHCFRLARIARLAGAPMDKGAGIELLKKIGDRVGKGEPIYRIHACFPTDFKFATELVAEDDGYALAPSS
ncbi:MAG TPA: thymidine phosphorylase family protein [Alphaproteobacteria bacterium]|jgi:thymidine phosphorylase|nr:thymidine phosphorylase family protein [Alphaproteobacteria bacterium]